MENSWFPSGSASAFSPPLDTTGDSRSLVPPHPLTLLTHLLLSLLLTTLPSPLLPPNFHAVLFVLAITSLLRRRLAQLSLQLLVMLLQPRSIVENLTSESFTIIPPKETSPTLTNKASGAPSTILPPLPTDKTNLIQNQNPNLNCPAPPSKTTPLLTCPPSVTNPQSRSIPTGPSLVERLRKKEDKTLTRLAPITLSDSGRPRVLIPDSVFQKGAELHKDLIVCHFNGRPPPFTQIQNVLNHMWGKGKDPK
ncbi:Uncharacterized protein Rs2_21007 [Raphanus sativus]|nr:Uncharacterized protein Rs2_21007 [Raphanus sativus]